MSHDREDIFFRSQYDVKEAILFCVELTSSMFQPNESLQKEYPLRELLKTLDSLMKELAITLPNTALGCYFFNSSITSPGCKDGIFEYFELKPLNTQVNKKIQDDLFDTDLKNEDKLDLKELFKMIVYENPKEFNDKRTYLNDVLNQVKYEFILKANNNKRYNHKRVFLITDNDKPYDPKGTNSDAMRRNIRALLGDLETNKISIVPFFLNTHKQFDNSIYSELFIMTNENKQDDLNDSQGSYYGFNMRGIDFNELREKIIRRREVKRMYFSSLLEIGPGLEIEINGYTLISKAEPKKAIAVYTKSEIPTTVLSKSKYYTENMSKEITDKKSQTIKGYKFGNDVVCLTSEQISNLRSFDDLNNEKVKKLKIIGFRKITKSFKFFYNLGTSPFVYVETKGNYLNSFRAFSSLFQSCKKLNQAAIVWGSIRKDSYSSLYALVPSQYDKLKTNQLIPQGFFLISLPFLDNIRLVPNEVKPTAIPDELLSSTKLLLEQFKLKEGYDPSKYSNPTLQWHYKILRDQALLAEVPEHLVESVESFTDDQLKDYVKFDKSCIRLLKYRSRASEYPRNDLINEIKSQLKLLPGDYNDEPISKPKRGRKK